MSTTELLRKAKVISVKLGLDEFSKWVDKELNGYGEDDSIPAYRTITGEPKAFNPFHGWQPVIFQTSERYELVSRRAIGQTVAELEEVSKNRGGGFQVPYPPELQQQLMRAIGQPLQVSMMVERSEVVGILEAVRTAILDWSLKLEQSGIVGEGMSFSKADREKAHEPSTVYTIGRIENFTGTMGPMSDQSAVSARTTINPDIAAIRRLISDIRKYEADLGLGSAGASELDTTVSELEVETAKDRPQEARMRSLLSSLRSILEGTTDSLIAQGILVEIGKHLR